MIVKNEKNNKKRNYHSKSGDNHDKMWNSIYLVAHDDVKSSCVGFYI